MFDAYSQSINYQEYSVMINILRLLTDLLDMAPTEADKEKCQTYLNRFTLAQILFEMICTDKLQYRKQVNIFYNFYFNI